MKKFFIWLVMVVVYYVALINTVQSIGSFSTLVIAVLYVFIPIIGIPFWIAAFVESDPKSRQGLTVFLLLSMAVIFYFCSGDHKAPTKPTNKTNWSTEDNSLLAYSVMEDFVKKKIKTPATAKFPGMFDGKADHITRLPNHSYKINSYVDAQNSFGATIRRAFYGEVRQTSEYDWELVSLIFK